MDVRERNELALAHEAIVRQEVRYLLSHVPRQVSCEDLHSAGMLALLDAVERYDRTRGELVPYLKRIIRFRMIDYVRASTRLPRQAKWPQFVNIEWAHSLCDHRSADPARETLKREVWDSVKLLPPRFRNLLYLRYRSGFTLRECAGQLGIHSESRAWQLEAWAIKELRRMLAA